MKKKSVNNKNFNKNFNNKNFKNDYIHVRKIIVYSDIPYLTVGISYE